MTIHDLNPDRPMLDELGLDLPAEHDLPTGADLSAVRERLLESALAATELASDLEGGDDEVRGEGDDVAAHVMPASALTELALDEPLPLWRTSLAWSLRLSAGVSLFLVIGVIIGFLSQLKVNLGPFNSAEVSSVRRAGDLEVVHAARPGSPGLIHLSGFDEVTSSWPIVHWGGRRHALWVPVPLGTQSAEIPVEAVVTRDGETWTAKTHIRVLPAEEESIKTLRVDPKKLLASKGLRREEREMIEGLILTASQQDLQNASPEPLFQGFGWPIRSGRITSSFGELRVFSNPGPGGEDITTVFDRHLGVDIADDRRVGVFSTQSGRVLKVARLEHGGVTVLLNHGQGVFSLYQHLESTRLQEGQRLLSGDVVGLNGTSGAASGPHVHFAVWMGGSWVDPEVLRSDKAEP